MYDRIVRKMSLKSGSLTEPQLFSSYLNRPNIVLLGDPGAGKSHLFENSARMLKASYLTARDFLNLPLEKFAETAELFIDALDEKRNGRGDNSTIDSLVSKLWEVKPPKVRISCRIADWQGEIDLNAFRSYFDQSGGYAVLKLEDLTKEEQIHIVESKHITLPLRFLEEAERKGLSDLLKNPQTLIMLSQVVNQGEWPKTKSELFRSCVELLLSEHNDRHSNSPHGVFTPAELLDAAGRLCAIRLISDIPGISISKSKSQTHSEYPTVRDLAIADIEEVKAVLGRRIFCAGLNTTIVDYTHRTIAEYLAASWLSKQVQNGLPVGRVQALLGVDGKPASELRGLHAWLPIFLVDQAEIFIEADPLGVLSYGDVASLSRMLRYQLLSRLERLAKDNPWFRHEYWEAHIWAGLSSKDLEQEFRVILKNPDSPMALRSLVLDAMSTGEAIQALLPELVSIATDESKSFKERNSSIKAIVRMGYTCQDTIVAIYHSLGSSLDDIGLRANILRHQPNIGLGSSEVANILIAALDINDENFAVGTLWKLEDVVPNDETGTVLDTLVREVKFSPQKHDQFRNIEVLCIVERLLVHYLGSGKDINVEKTLIWLSFRHQLAQGGNTHLTEELRNTLAKSAIVVNLCDAEIASWELGEFSSFLWRIHEFMKITLLSIDNHTLLERVVAAMPQSNDKKKVALYEAAFSLGYSIKTDSSALFEHIYSLADESENLRPIREVCCISHIEKWRQKDYENKAQNLEKLNTTRERNRTRFDEDRQEIENGTDYGWLAWIGRIWYQFHDKNRHQNGLQRLVSELGEERTKVALIGVFNYLKRGDITPIAEVIKLHTNGKVDYLWYTVLCGLEGFVHKEEDLREFSDDYLQSALAIALYYPIMRYEGNLRTEMEGEWKVVLLQTRPGLSVEVYMALARNDLQRKNDYIWGLDEFLRQESLATFRSHAATSLLSEFPLTSPRYLFMLLRVLLKEGNFGSLRVLTESAIEKSHQESEPPTCYIWLAVGFIVAPEKYKPYIIALPAEDTCEIFWSWRELIGSLPKQSEKSPILPLEQFELMITLGGEQFPWAECPSGWSGDRNPWDASEFIRKMISQVAELTLPEASNLLSRLLKCEHLITYREYLQHMLTKHHMRRIDAEFKQPTWEEALRALQNKTPANIADLHALVCSHVEDLKTTIKFTNTDIYKRFWNEDYHARITTPKVEESARDVLIDLLRPKLSRQRISVDPEGHMVKDKRADIITTLGPMRVVIELKRDYHENVWSALQDQLERFYTRDPGAQGFGIYAVFWYGKKRSPCRIPRPPLSISPPSSAEEMEHILNSLIAQDKQAKIKAYVIDVSGLL